jgi:hypothetical protein
LLTSIVVFFVSFNLSSLQSNAANCGGGLAASGQVSTFDLFFSGNNGVSLSLSCPRLVFCSHSLSLSCVSFFVRSDWRWNVPRFLCLCLFAYALDQHHSRLQHWTEWRGWLCCHRSWSVCLPACLSVLLVFYLRLFVSWFDFQFEGSVTMTNVVCQNNLAVYTGSLPTCSFSFFLPHWLGFLPLSLGSCGVRLHLGRLRHFLQFVLRLKRRPVGSALSLSFHLLFVYYFLSPCAGCCCFFCRGQRRLLIHSRVW